MYIRKKKRFGLSFLLIQVKTFYLRYTIIQVTLLANTPRNVKDAKMAQVLQFLLTLLRRGFSPFTGPGVGLWPL